MKTTTKVGIAVGCALLALGGGVLILPTVTQNIEQRGQTALQRRGIALTYDTSDWGVDSGELTNVSVTWSTKGVSCTFKSLALNVGLFNAIVGTPKLDHVELLDGECDIDRSKLGKTDVQTTTADIDGKSGGLLKELLASPPSLEIRNLAIRTDGAIVSIESATVDDSGDVAFSGAAAAFDRQTDFVGTGTLDNESGLIDIIVRNSSDKPLVEIARGETTTLSVDTVSLAASYRERTGLVSLHDVIVRRNQSNVELKRVEISRSPRPTITITGGDAVVSLSDLKSLRGGATPKKELMDIKSKNAVGIDFREQLRRMDLRWRDVNLHVARSENRITLFEKVEGTFAADRIAVKGIAAAGTFDASAQFDRRRFIPLTAEAKLRNVELSNIPGLASARSQLPNRGTSGAIGGKLNGTISWRRSISVATPSELAFAGFWDQGELDLDGLSQEAIKEISMRWVGSASVDQNFRAVRLRSTLSSRGVNLTLNGEAEDWPIDPKVSIVVAAETLDCQSLVDGLPPGLLGGYRNAKFAGKATPRIAFELPFNRPGDLTLEVTGYDKCEVKSLNALPSVRPKIRLAGSEKTVRPDDVLWLEKSFIIPVSEGVKDDADILVGPGTKMYLSLTSLPKHTGAAAFLSEETGFYDGHAINFGLVQRALRRNLEEGRFVYGGSTVTQQLVKNLFLTRDKTIARKIQEMIVAWRIDQVISKDRILELYINCIEYGPNIYGIGPASRYYFQKSAVKLEPKESIFLAMLKPAPWQGRGFVRRGASPVYPWWTERIEILFKRLVEFKYLTEEQALAQKPWGLTWEAGKYKPHQSVVSPEPENQVKENDVK